MKALIYIIIAALAPLTALRNRIENHDPEALFQLAMILEKGYDSIPQDTVQAVDLLSEAARLGYPPAQNYLGFLFGSGRLGLQNPDSAIFWISRAADAGDPKAANNLAFLLLEKQEKEADSLAACYLLKAAEAGLPTAKVTLGSLLTEGRGVRPDTVRANSLFRSALKDGFREAELYLLNTNAKAWLALPPVARLDTALNYLRLGSPLIGMELLADFDDITIAGSTTVCSDGPALDRKQIARVFALFGNAFSRGSGVTYDHNKANKYFAAAALLGNPSAAFIFAETLDIFPGLIGPSLFTDAELEALRSAGADLDVTADELRKLAAENGITDAGAATKALL